MEDLVIKISWVWGEVVQCTQRHRSKANVEIQIKLKKKMQQLLNYGLHLTLLDMGIPFQYLHALPMCWILVLTRSPLNRESRCLYICSVMLLVLLIMNAFLYMSACLLTEVIVIHANFSYILKDVCLSLRGPWHQLKLQPTHMRRNPEHESHSTHLVVQYAVDLCAYVRMHLFQSDPAWIW